MFPIFSFPQLNTLNVTTGEGNPDTQSASGTVVCVDPVLAASLSASGQSTEAAILWRGNVPAWGSVVGSFVRVSPVIDADGFVYAMTWDNGLAKLDPQTGQVLAASFTPGKNCTTPVLDRSARLIFGTGAQLRAVNTVLGSFTGTGVPVLPVLWTAGVDEVGISTAGGIGLDCSGRLYYSVFRDQDSFGRVYRVDPGSGMLAAGWPTLQAGNRRTANAIAYEYITDRWCIVELSPSGTGSTQGVGIDELGRAVGSATVNSNPDSANFWTAPAASSSPQPIYSVTSVAVALTANGWAAGYSSAASLAPVAWQNLGSLNFSSTTLGAPGVMSIGFQAYATDVLPDGTIIGYGNGSSLVKGILKSLNTRGIKWTRNGNTWTAAEMGDDTVYQSLAYAMNGSQQIVGALRTTASSPLKAFKTAPSVLSIVALASLGTLSGDPAHTSSARDINSLGDCVGFSQITGGQTRGFILMAGNPALSATTTTIGTLGGNASEAYGVNDSRDVVGRANNAAGSYRAFLYTRNGTLRDLNTIIGNSGWTLTGASAINSAGVIVGNGTLTGLVRGYLLIPTP